MKYFFIPFFGVIAFALAVNAFANPTWAKMRHNSVDYYCNNQNRDECCSQLGQHTHNPHTYTSCHTYSSNNCECNLIQGGTGWDNNVAFLSTGTCAKEYWDYTTHLCSDEPVCPEGQQWDTATQSCTGLCGPDQDYVPPGYCFDRFPESDCQNVVGTFNGQEVCRDNQDQCESEGGTYGFFNDNEVCIPPDFAQEEPSCPPGQVNVFNGTSYECGTPDTPTNPDPDQKDPDDPDGDGLSNDVDDDDDGDGIPDASDPDANGDGRADTDTDGDGIPDYVDTDDDNDGVPDADDKDQDGNSAGDCDPQDKDYAQCIGQLESIDTNYSQNLITNANSKAHTGLDQWERNFTNSLGDGDSGISGPGGIAGDITGGILDPGSCVDYSADFYGSALTISCAKTQIIRDILAWVIAIYTLLHVFFVATRPAGGAK